MRGGGDLVIGHPAFQSILSRLPTEQSREKDRIIAHRIMGIRARESLRRLSRRGQSVLIQPTLAVHLGEPDPNLESLFLRSWISEPVESVGGEIVRDGVDHHRTIRADAIGHGFPLDGWG